jgi:deoxyribodipyrimidine photo-lyase
MVNIKRVRNLKKGLPFAGPVLYWMSREQRVSDNWALAWAIENAEDINQPVMVIFALTNNFLGATWRQYDFLLKGLKKVEAMLISLNIPFFVLIGNPVKVIPQFIKQNKIGRMVVDFDPLTIKREWLKGVLESIDISVDEVDAHNIVPCWITSDKEEYSAATFRPKIKKLIPEFLDDYPPLVRQQGIFHIQGTHWEAISMALKTDRTVQPVEWLAPGEKGARTIFNRFLENKIGYYSVKRNDPNAKPTSGLSAYLHFGHISSQRIAIDIVRNLQQDENTNAFLEELIVRKELADNFCHYNPNYYNVRAFKPWALKTLDDHRDDKREYIYSIEQFELALTNDSLWNAAQHQMVFTGSMHGYLRMYWAKKVLEWSVSPEEALNTAIYLNDKYQLDGRDSNGYTGCAWSIGGVHDRPWSERNVFGKIRFMNRKGCERKFDVDRYISDIEKVNKAQQ